MARLARGERCQVLFCGNALGNQNQGKKVPDTFRSADRARGKENSIVSPEFHPNFIGAYRKCLAEKPL
jgi:hypothetical protein